MARRWRTFLALWLAAAAWGPVQAGALNPVRVHLPAQASVLGPDFSVGEVAQVSGDDDSRCDRIRKVSVGRAPLPGHSLVINAATIRVALRKAGFGAGDAVVDEGETAVSADSQDYPLQNLLPVIRTDILRSTGEDPANVRVEPSASFDKTIPLPKGKVTTALRPPVSGRYDGSVLYVVDLSVDGRKTRTLPLRVTVQIERPAVVVTHRVERGEKFAEKNVELQRIETAVSADSVTVLSEALGRTSARAIFPGTVLREQDIADPPVVQRGQEVTCRSRTGNVEIEVMVRTLQDGKMGRVIRVENTGSHKVFRARVVDENTVEAVSGPEAH